jgi:hypothetical protein
MSNPPPMYWIPIAERLPEVGETVLVSVPASIFIDARGDEHHYPADVRCLTLSSEGSGYFWESYEDQGIDLHAASHWMPLPPPAPAPTVIDRALASV